VTSESAVVADVDHDALGVPEAVDLVLKAHQRRLVHRPDVDVGDLAVGDLLDVAAVVLDPLLVLDVAQGVDRADADVVGPVGGGGGRGPGEPGSRATHPARSGIAIAPGIARARRRIHRNRHVVVERVVEDLPVVVRRRDALMVDGHHRVAHLQVDPLLVGRAVTIDVADHVAVAGGRQLEARA
jgi:hypothetical protein